MIPHNVMSMAGQLALLSVAIANEARPAQVICRKSPRHSYNVKGTKPGRSKTIIELLDANPDRNFCTGEVAEELEIAGWNTDVYRTAELLKQLRISQLIASVPGRSKHNPPMWFSIKRGGS